MRNIFQYICLFLFLFTFSCVPPKTEILTEINLDINDPQLQKIYSFQDEGRIDSLMLFFEHEDPTYRYAAAMAMGSVRDVAVLTDLSTLLSDKVEKVRLAAAYAIGQIGETAGESLLINGFDSADTLRQYKKSNGAILEAIGKCGSEESLQFLSTIKGYTSRDTALLDGQAWGIYRYATRGMTVPEGTKQMVNLVKDIKTPTSTRVIAANYLYRAKDIQLDSMDIIALAKILEQDKDPRIRMTTAIALGKAKTPLALQALTSQFAKDQDYRVKCNILRALGNFPYPEMQGRFFEIIKMPQTKVAYCAADFFLQNGESRDAQVYWRRARALGNWPVKMQMYKAANRHMPAAYTDYKWSINNDLTKIYQDTTKNIYQRAEALHALGEYAWNYKFLNEQVLTATSPVLKTAAMDAFAMICSDPDFDKNIGVSRVRIKKEISAMLSQIMTEGDVGVKYIAANLLSKPLGFKALYENSSFLHVAKRSLELPKETETLYAIEKAIAFFEDKEYTPPKPDYNHPLTWSHLAGVTTDSKAIVKTSQGTITMRLLPLAAPASVANFMQLAKQGFYEGKPFHRVVPNFVVQGGCPRGDGYGGLDYSIRTEVPLMHYDDEGYVGMASAGPDTEGTQWFITHSPTPHLDGKYTIIAKVIEGIEIVHRINVGDTIESVTFSL